MAYGNLMKKISISAFSLAFLAGGFFIISYFVFAQVESGEPSNASSSITFPIAELGNCTDKASCKAFCDTPGNTTSCMSFAAKHGLVKNAVAQVPQEGGPGGCKNNSECRAYCSKPENKKSCVDFAAEKGYITREEAERTNKFLSTTPEIEQKKSGPGGCDSEESCKAYCGTPEHLKECILFAKDKGLVTEDTAQRILKTTEVLVQGGPGGCKDPDACRKYCSEPAHFEECINFASKNGIVGQKEAKFFNQSVNGVKRLAPEDFTGPGGCKGKEACHAYCEVEEHTEECIKFGEEKGFMSKEEAQRARQFQNKPGPGNCRGPACKVYCEDPAHAEECISFAQKEGIMDNQEAERAKKFLEVSRKGGPGGCIGQQCQTYCSNSEHDEECFNFAKTNNLISKEEIEESERGMQISKKVKESGGPGGCSDDNSCKEYCKDSSHMEECLSFAVAHGGVDRGTAERMLKHFVTVEESFRSDNFPQEFPRQGPPQFQFPGKPGEFPGQNPQGGFPPANFQGFPGEQDTFHEFNIHAENEAKQKMYERLRRFEDFGNLEQSFRGGSGFGQGFSIPGQGSGPFQFPGKPEEFPGQNPQGGFPPSLGVPPGNTQNTSGFSGPGGCRSPQECIRYCFAHHEECGLTPPSVSSQSPKFIGPPAQTDTIPPQNFESTPNNIFLKPQEGNTFGPSYRPPVEGQQNTPFDQFNNMSGEYKEPFSQPNFENKTPEELKRMREEYINNQQIQPPKNNYPSYPTEQHSEGLQPNTAYPGIPDGAQQYPYQQPLYQQSQQQPSYQEPYQQQPLYQQQPFQQQPYDSNMQYNQPAPTSLLDYYLASVQHAIPWTFNTLWSNIKLIFY